MTLGTCWEGAPVPKGDPKAYVKLDSRGTFQMYIHLHVYIRVYYRTVLKFSLFVYAEYVMFRFQLLNQLSFKIKEFVLFNIFTYVHTHTHVNTFIFTIFLRITKATFELMYRYVSCIYVFMYLCKKVIW